MRKVILLMFCLFTINVFGQNEKKEVSATQDTIKKDTIQVLKNQNANEKNLEEQLREVTNNFELQKKRLLELQDIETKLAFSEKENNELNKKLESANKHVESVEKNLISIASNFLYVPYEAYGIEEIAIKAFESVQNDELKQKYAHRYILLKNYQQHLQDFKAYLLRVQKACNGAFQATATEFIDPTDPSVSPDLVLKKQSFYVEYIKYDGYQETFIGGLIQKTEEILKAHTKQNRANMKEVIDTIDKTQTPVKIDSISDITELINTRLKTIEFL